MREHKSIQSKLNKRTEAPSTSLSRKITITSRYAKIVIRTKRLYMLDEDLEIIDLTTDVGTGSNTSTPFSTPQRRHKLDCDELDAL